MAIIGEKTLSDQSDLEPFPATYMFINSTLEKRDFNVSETNVICRIKSLDDRMNKWFPSSLREHVYEAKTA